MAILIGELARSLAHSPILASIPHNDGDWNSKNDAKKYHKQQCAECTVHNPSENVSYGKWNAAYDEFDSNTHRKHYESKSKN